MPHDIYYLLAIFKGKLECKAQRFDNITFILKRCVRQTRSHFFGKRFKGCYLFVGDGLKLKVLAKGKSKMTTYDFSKVDFTNPEVRASLARAYAVVMRITVAKTFGGTGYLCRAANRSRWLHA